MKIIISGGGTGGHVFPSISIANALKTRLPDAEILFVGAKNRMEMQHVPMAGYSIVGLPISGFNRKNLFKNIFVLWNLCLSFVQSYKLIINFQPDVAIGMGGYASGPLLYVASKKKIPILIQEQNSVAGITNLLLANKASKICVAYNNMEQFFKKEKIVLTGNPIRQDLILTEKKKQQGYKFFKLNPQKKTILILGGSLGATTFNKSMISSLKQIEEDKHIQWIWQAGSKLDLTDICLPDNVYLTSFISCMDLAYSVADLVISRAGAISISELCYLKKPTIFVPSPNVTKDHQTKNAQMLSANTCAAIVMTDKEAENNLINKALILVHNTSKLKQLSENIFQYAYPEAAYNIANEILTLLNQNIFSTSNLYFIGAGGIGMSNLVQYFLFYKKNIAGYDIVESTITKRLNSLGASIHYKDDINYIPNIFKNRKNTKIIITPAIPNKNIELTYFRNKKFTIIKRAALLAIITQSKQVICIAGTHGKTTTSSMIAHILKNSKIDCNAFLGGILNNYHTNFLLSKKSNLTVVEADEYDHSFYWLSPFTAVITSVDADHLDIYETEHKYKKSFEYFTSLIRPGGILLIEEKVKITPKIQNKVKIYRYSGEIIKNKFSFPDFYAKNIRIEQEQLYFDFIAPNNMIIQNIVLKLPITINIVNSVAALAVAWLHGANTKELKQGLASFNGIKRRFDFHIKTDTLVLIDDYAHHPKELEQSIISIQTLYPNRKLTIVFQPHLYSRTSDFYKEFAQSLSLANEVILLPIYPARESAIPGISSRLILDLVEIKNKKEIEYDKLIHFLSNRRNDIILMAGAGDIELLINPLKKALLFSLKRK